MNFELVLRTRQILTELVFKFSSYAFVGVIKNVLEFDLITCYKKVATFITTFFGKSPILDF